MLLTRFLPSSQSTHFTFLRLLVQTFYVGQILCISNPINNRNNLLFLPTSMSLASFFLIFLCYHALPALADPRATEVAVLCTNTTAPMPQRQAFLTNFYDALEALTALVTRQKYAFVVKGTTQNNATVYAFGECAKDLTKPDCDVCFAQCKTRVLRCSPFQRGIDGGMFFFDGCFLRYFLFFIIEIVSWLFFVSRIQEGSNPPSFPPFLLS